MTMDKHSIEKRVLLLVPAGVEIRSIVQGLERVGAAVDIQTYHADVKVADIIWRGPYLVGLVACRQLLSDEGEGRQANLATIAPVIASFQREFSCPIIIVGDHHNSCGLVEVLNIRNITGIVAWTDSQARRQAVVAVDKIINRDLWGMERYFQRETPIRSFAVTSSGQRDKLLSELAEYLAPFKANRRIVAAAQSVADEFVMNAVYNAPTGPSGEHLYASRSRTEAVDLSSGDAALFRYTCDGERVFLSIADRFGSLEPDKVKRYLIRGLKGGAGQIEQKEGGAGLGLYTLLKSANRLIINIAPGVGTEMIAVLEVSGSFKRFLARPKSFHLFHATTKPHNGPQLSVSPLGMNLDP